MIRFRINVSFSFIVSALFYGTNKELIIHTTLHISRLCAGNRGASARDSFRCGLIIGLNPHFIGHSITGLVSIPEKATSNGHGISAEAAWKFRIGIRERCAEGQCNCRSGGNMLCSFVMNTVNFKHMVASAPFLNRYRFNRPAIRAVDNIPTRRVDSLGQLLILQYDRLHIVFHNQDFFPIQFFHRIIHGTTNIA